MSCNAAAVKNRLPSLVKIINELDLKFFCLQETHVKREGTIKFEKNETFQIYEQVRKSKSGGGLVTGVLKSLNPFWIRDAGDQVEALKVKINKTRVIKG